MVFSDSCIYASRRTCSLLKNIYNDRKFKPEIMTIRTFFFKNNKKLKEPSNYNKSADNEKGIKPLSGFDDDNYTHNLKYFLSNPKLYKTGLVNFAGEFKKLYYEEKDKYAKAFNPRVDDPKGRVDMLYTFEAQKDLEKFSVNTDSSYNLGYSSASLSLTNEGTGLFRGNICSEIPKDGNVKTAGYATILSHKEHNAFYRPKKLNWSEYTDLVFKIRGDGRTYMVILNLDTPYLETKYTSYAHYLYTRGGPYWQIAKLQLSHFFTMTKGTLHIHQGGQQGFSKIVRFGITAAGFEGPFKLEIDYIGLEVDHRFKTVCPYEEYR